MATEPGTGNAEPTYEHEAFKGSIEAARSRIEQEASDVAASTAQAAGEVGIIRSLVDVARRHKGTFQELMWKDLKATGAAALSIVPLVGEAGSVAKVGAAVAKGRAALSAEKAVWVSRGSTLDGTKALARLDRLRARRELWEAMKKVPRNPVRLVSDPLLAGKEAWARRGTLRSLEQTPVVVPRAETDPIAAASKVVLEGIRAGRIADAKTAYNEAKRVLGKDLVISGALHLMHKVDPFPDVPPTIAMVAGFAEFVLPGANIVPALWQLAHNKVEWVKTYGGMALDMGKVVLTRFDKKLAGMKQPQVARAAAAFAHG